MLADQFAKEVDFFSIGTNDLINTQWRQTIMGEQVSYLTNHTTSVILCLINSVIKAAHAGRNGLDMCGEDGW